MADQLDVPLLTAWLGRAAAAIEAQQGYLSDLDAAIGDGDHGANLARGFKAVMAKLGTHADMSSGMRPLTDDELAMLREQTRYTYVQFLDRVAKGRHMPASSVDKIAQGHVWVGSEAQKLGLVDQIGGLETAIAQARSAAKLDPATSILEFFPEPPTLIDVFQNNRMETQIQHTMEAADRYRHISTRLLMPPLGN